MESNGNTSTSHDQQDQFTHCFENCMAQQEENLKQLNQAITTSNSNDETLRNLVETILNHFQDYTDKRMALARRDTPCFFSPTRNSSFENSYLWIAGCRPSLFIRFVYSLNGSSLDAHMEEFLQGVRRGNLGELSAEQLGLINELHCRVVAEERQTSELASLKERMADQKFVAMANEFWGRSSSSSSKVIRRVLDEDALGLRGVMERQISSG